MHQFQSRQFDKELFKLLQQKTTAFNTNGMLLVGHDRINHFGDTAERLFPNAVARIRDHPHMLRGGTFEFGLCVLSST